jgi:hypothetical protein
MSRAYLCVSIDTESDKARGHSARHPMAFEGITDGVVKRLHPLFERFGARPTYLLSPEVLRHPASVETFRRLAPSCELGTLLHGEYADPEPVEPSRIREFQRDYTPDVERRKLTYLTDLFIHAFGHQPQSFRAGRFGIGPASLGILAALGYAVDSSVTPHVEGPSSGAPGLSFRDASSQPYRPDPCDPGRPGHSPVLEVPVTIRRRFLSSLPLVGRRAGARWLRPTTGSAEALVRIAEDELASARRSSPTRPVILNAMLQNVDVVSWASPRASNEEESRAILDRLRALLAFARREAIAVVGLGDVPAILAMSGATGTRDFDT